MIDILGVDRDTTIWGATGSRFRTPIIPLQRGCVHTAITSARKQTYVEMVALKEGGLEWPLKPSNYI